MKKTFFIMLLLSFMIFLIISPSCAEECQAVPGICWGDSTESVQNKLGGKLRHVGEASALLSFTLNTGGMHSTYQFFFINDKLYMVNLISYMLDNEYFSDAYYATMVEDYGEPVRTNSESIYAETVTEDPNGELYYWKVGEKTSIFMEANSFRVTLTYKEINEKASETDAKEDLIFRGIPWGTDLPTVIDSIKDVSFNSPSDDYAVTTSRRCLDNGDSFGFGVGINTYSQKRINVAGYEATIVLGFAYTPNEKGLLTKDEKDTAFTYAEYRISHKDARFAVEDLKNKLTDIYGEPEHIQKNVVIEYDTYYWKGANGTIISLEGEFYSSGSTYVTIYYSYYGADDLYKQAQEAVNLEERLNTDKDDHSGL